LIALPITVVATIQTFVLAGAETSSTALTWASWVLASRPDVQEALRAELSAMPMEQPSMLVPSWETHSAYVGPATDSNHFALPIRFCRNELDGLPYLDAFVHEVMRIFSPVPQTRRDSIKEATIPLRHPIMGRNGQMMDSIVVPKDTPCMLGESRGLR